MISQQYLLRSTYRDSFLPASPPRSQEIRGVTPATRDSGGEWMFLGQRIFVVLVHTAVPPSSSFSYEYGVVLLTCCILPLRVLHWFPIQWLLSSFLFFFLSNGLTVFLFIYLFTRYFVLFSNLSGFHLFLLVFSFFPDSSVLSFLFSFCFSDFIGPQNRFLFFCFLMKFMQNSFLVLIVFRVHFSSWCFLFSLTHKATIPCIMCSFLISEIQGVVSWRFNFSVAHVIFYRCRLLAVSSRVMF